MEIETTPVTYRALDEDTTRRLDRLVRRHNPRDIARATRMSPRMLYLGLLEMVMPVEQADRLTARLATFERHDTAF